MDYNVQTKVSFQLDFDGSGEFNMLLLSDIQKQFAQHVKEVYEQDSTLGDGYVSSDLNFHFNGRTVKLEYTFSCHDENAAEGFGCKVQKIDCKAEEADMTWLDQLEDAIFGPRESAQKQPPAEEKSGKKAAAKKKTSREGR